MRNSSSILLIITVLAINVVMAQDIAYLREHDDVWQVWLTDFEKASHTVLTQDDVDKTRLSWSRNKSKLLVNRNDGSVCWLIIKGQICESIKLPFTNILDAKLSYDDQWVAYTRVSYEPKLNYNLYRTRISDGLTDALTNQTDLQFYPSWSSDDKKMLYVVADTMQNNTLWELDVASKSQYQISDINAYGFDPVFNTRGDLLYVSNESGHYDIWFKAVGEKSARNLTNDDANDAAPTWSPDNTQFAYETNRGGFQQIYIMNIKTGTKTLLTPMNTNSRAPVWTK